jgi:hypothetical protein
MRIVFLAVIAAFGVSLRADSIAITLVDPADPVQIVSARLDFGDATAPAMLVGLENRTPFPINTREVWFYTARFFTRAEVDRAGDRKIWECARMGGAEFPPLVSIAPGARAVVRLPIGECAHALEHEHFFVEVERLGKMSSPSWKRDPAEFSRLLSAAMPHE